MNQPNEGDLRVWYNTEVGNSNIKSFYQPVGNIEEARLVVRTLFTYDKYQMAIGLRKVNNAKEARIGGLEIYEKGVWREWVGAFDAER